MYNRRSVSCTRLERLAFSALLCTGALSVACVPVQSAQTTQASSDESCVSAQAQDAPYVAELPQGDVEAICQIIEGLQRVTRQRDDSCYERAQVGPGMRLGEYQPWFLEASPKMLHLWLRPRDPMSGADGLQAMLAECAICPFRPHGLGTTQSRPYST